jgi:TonB family protein
MPVAVPTTPIPVIIDEPRDGFVPSAPEGFGKPGGFVDGIMEQAGRESHVPMPRIPDPVIKAAAPEPLPVIRRFRAGGNVSLGAVLHRVEPPYPALAKATHTSGIVELECVVGVDGRIKEVKVRSGNAFLARAAVEAAWQWVYVPSKLNGMPIEVITNLTFTFKLN